jgi:hypothetical protein
MDPHPRTINKGLNGAKCAQSIDIIDDKQGNVHRQVFAAPGLHQIKTHPVLSPLASFLAPYRAAECCITLTIVQA